MPKQDFRSLLQLSIKKFSMERFTGPVESAEVLLQPRTLVELDAHYPGAYCFVVHDPAVDTDLNAYLNGDGIKDDSGKSVMVLFEPVPQRRRAMVATGVGLGELGETRPMADFVRGLLPGKSVILPGAVLLARLSTPNNPIYVALEGPDGVKSLRALLARSAANIDPQSGVLDTDAVARALAIAGERYQRGETMSVSEALRVALRKLWDVRKDLAVLIGTGIKLARGKAE